MGAEVRVLATIGGKTFWQLREITAGSGYCSQDDLRAHFGLGDATKVEKVLIEWPSGITQILKDRAVNQHLTVEGDPIPVLALSFSEGGGAAILNLGVRAGAGEIVEQGDSPCSRLKFRSVGPRAPRNRQNPARR